MYSNLITLQFGQLSYAAGNAFFCHEREQIYEQNDPIDHSNLFKSLQTTTPRNIAWGYKDSLDVLKFYQSASLKTKIQKENGKSEDSLNPIESLLWDNSKIQKIDEENKEQSKEYDQDKNNNNEDEENILTNNKFFPLFKSTLFDKKYQLELPYLLDQKFESYVEGNILAKSALVRDYNEDKVRLMLEETDYVSGFQVFVDSNSGFGGLCEEVLNIVVDECSKKPIITFSLHDSLEQGKSQNAQAHKTNSFVNEILSLDRFRQISSVLVPIDVSRLSLFGKYVNYNQAMDTFDRAQLIGTLMSGFTGSYRSENCSYGLSEYVKNIVSTPSNNIFNSTFTIPLIKDEEGELTNSHIFNVNNYPNQFQYLYCDIPKCDKSVKVPRSFGEAYFLRGMVKMPEEPPKSTHLDLRIIEGIINYKTKLHQHLFSKCIQETYLYQLDTRENYHEFQLPLHTAIVSNELLAPQIKSLLQRQSQLTKANKVAYYALDYSEEEFGEMKQHFEDLYEAYAPNEEDNDY